MNQSKEKTGGIRVLGYGIGSMAKDLSLGVIGSYLLSFYTDVFGIGAAAAGAILVLTKIWDAINDPMMGAIVDRSPRTRWGRYRPYILFTPIPLAILSAMCFLSPDFSLPGKIAFAAITYTLTGMLFTAYDVPLWGMVPSLTADFNTRNKYIASARTFTTLAMLIASAAAMPVIQAIGGGDGVENLRKGYPIFMLILGIFGIVCAIITFCSTKEVVYDDEATEKKKKETGIFKQFFQVMNKPLFICLLVMLFNAMNMILPSVAGVYYMTYYLGRPDMIPVYMMVSMGTGLVTSVTAPMMMRKFTAKSLTITAFAVSAVVGVIVFVLGRGSLPLLLVLFAVCGLCTGTMMVSITSMLTDTSDYIARTRGNRVDGVVFSMNSFAIKVGQAVASGAVSLILAVTGYVANAQQTDLAANGILMTRSLLPTIVAVIGLVLTLSFKIPDRD